MIAAGRIDVHTHGIPERLPDFGSRYGGNWPDLIATSPCAATMTLGGKHFRDIDHRCWDPEQRIEQMDEDGVGLQVISPIPVTMSYSLPAGGVTELSRVQNEWLAEVTRAHPSRFAGLGTVPFQDPETACSMVDEIITEQSLAGVEIATNVDAAPLDEARFEPVFSALAERDALVLIHPWQVMGAERLSAYNLAPAIGMGADTAQAAARLVLGGVLDRHPNLRIVLAHGGGAFLWLLPRIAAFAELDGVAGTLELPVVDYARRFLYDTLVFAPGHLSWAIEAVGPDRFVVGTDYPFAVAERPAGAILEDIDLPAGDREDILRRTALSLLEKSIENAAASS